MAYTIRAVTTGEQVGPAFDLLADAVQYGEDELALVSWYYDLFDDETSSGCLTEFLSADAAATSLAKLRAQFEVKQ